MPKSKPTTNTGQKLLDTKFRDIRIWKARVKGKSIEAIAEEEELAPKTIANILNKVADEYELEAAADLIKLELDRLDLLLQNAIKVLEARHLSFSHGRILHDDMGRTMRDSKPVLDAIQTVIKIMDRRAKYLGLDAPSKTEQTIQVFKTNSEGTELQQLIEQARKRSEAITTEALQALPQTPQHDTTPAPVPTTTPTTIEGTLA